jgi:DNA mismatch repair protein MutL
MSIQILSEQLAAQIAAGEVIERPASVVKELVENALDAGATQIVVEAREGGKRLIRVGDNGSGIASDEAELAFVHHATSKLTSADDLFAIRTLGFRGEALPSIAAVANVTMLTRAQAEELGVELKLTNSQVISRVPHAAPPGTIVTVENLFHNIPARLKFLKSTQTESSHIHDLVSRYALAYPQVRFSLTSEGRLAFQSSGSGAMGDVLVVVYGVETAKQMIEVQSSEFKVQSSKFKVHGSTTEAQTARAAETEFGASEPATLNLDPNTLNGEELRTLKVEGFISRPTLTRANRAHIVFFVNGRAVQDRSLNYAVTEAYHTLLQVGRYPMCVLQIMLPPDQVDVNVHPTKAEVRFRDPHAVFSAVQRAVRATLQAHQVVPSLSSQMSVVSSQMETGRGTIAWSAAIERQTALRNLGQAGMELQRTEIATSNFQLPNPNLQIPTTDEQPSAQTTSNLQPPIFNLQSPLPMLRVLGQVGRTYIVAEGPEGIFLIDQHAAHERVLYERFMRERAEREARGEMGVSAQTLLEPLPLTLGARQAAQLDEQLSLLRSAGFDIEPFGGATFLIRAVPSILAEGDPRQALTIILDEMVDPEEYRPQRGEHRGLAGHENDPLHRRKEAMLIASVCKQAAIKGGRLLTMPEMQELTRQLEATSAPRTCPHGRPTMIRLGFETLAREFGR